MSNWPTHPSVQSMHHPYLAAYRLDHELAGTHVMVKLLCDRAQLRSVVDFAIAMDR